MKYLIFLLFAQVVFSPTQPKSKAGGATHAQQVVVPDYVFNVIVEKNGTQSAAFDKSDGVNEVLHIQGTTKKVIKLGDRPSTVTVKHVNISTDPKIRLQLRLDPSDTAPQYQGIIGERCYHLLKYLEAGLSTSSKRYLLDRTNFAGPEFDSSFREGFNSKAAKAAKNEKIRL
jgi:hypothetical protein